jgi:hypothetical protein
MKQCLDRNPVTRISVNEMMGHSWMKKWGIQGGGSGIQGGGSGIKIAQHRCFSP